MERRKRVGEGNRREREEDERGSSQMVHNEQHTTYKEMDWQLANDKGL